MSESTTRTNKIGNSSQRIPHFRWAQDKANLFLTIEICNVEGGKVDIEDEYFRFSGCKGDVTYLLEFPFSKLVSAKDSRFTYNGCELQILIRKKESGKSFWGFIYSKDLKKKFKCHCKCDWNLWRDESDDESDDETKDTSTSFGKWSLDLHEYDEETNLYGEMYTNIESQGPPPVHHTYKPVAEYAGQKGCSNPHGYPYNSISYPDHPLNVRREFWGRDYDDNLSDGNDARQIVVDMKPTIYRHIGQLAVSYGDPSLPVIKTASLTRCLKEDGSCSDLYLVTCAHNIAFKNEKGKMSEITEGTFHLHQKGKGYTALKLKKWAYYPKYKGGWTEALSGYDYAIAAVEQPPALSPPKSGRYVSHSSLLDPVAKGRYLSKLRVTGYKQRDGRNYEDKLSENMVSMVGNLLHMDRYVDEEHGIFLYKNIDTTSRQSGAPLFAVPPFPSQVHTELETLNRNQNANIEVDNLVGIRCGVHVGSFGDLSYATMETKAIATWRYEQLKKWGIV